VNPGRACAVYGRGRAIVEIARGRELE